MTEFETETPKSGLHDIMTILRTNKEPLRTVLVLTHPSNEVMKLDSFLKIAHPIRPDKSSLSSQIFPTDNEILYEDSETNDSHLPVLGRQRPHQICGVFL